MPLSIIARQLFSTLDLPPLLLYLQSNIKTGAVFGGQVKSMKGLTLTTKAQTKLQILNGVLEGRWSMRETTEVLGVSERQGWRLLAAYRKEGAAALAHGNRCRVPWNATPAEMTQQVIALSQGRYKEINHTHPAELLAQREGIMLSRSTVRRFPVGAGVPSPRRLVRCRRDST